MFDLSQWLQRYENCKIAIYGLSVETEKVLSEIGMKFQIIGLLDGFKDTGSLYGKPIISMETAIADKVNLILVVARPGSCKAIARRIGKTCAENHIDLFDIRGKDLCDIQEASYAFNTANGITRNQFQIKMDEFEVVSIDLFDTLIMRQTLFPSDIFELVDGRLRSKGISIENFSGKRLDSEKYLSQYQAPTLTDIYAYMIDTYSIQGVKAEELTNLEWTVDYDLLIPRGEICAIMSEVHTQGKEVYIVSDIFYTKEQIIKILEKCNINFYTDILLSCEYKTGKKQNLFDRLKDVIGEKKCIHIGDDIIADIESAERNAISACLLYSGIELLEMAGYLGLWDSMETVSDRIRIGLFVAQIFNSPFQFEHENSQITVKKAYDIGYLFLAPMITDFVIWFHDRVKGYNLQNVWFCARDGYLIKKLYDELTEDTSSVYFMTSRTAAIRAGVDNESDIQYVEQMKFSGTLQEQIKERFGILIDDNEADHNELMTYKQVVLKKAAANKKNYQTYINKLNIKNGDIAFFDFVAKGTSQMYIERLIENHLKGLYFLQLEKENMREKGLDIDSFYNSDDMNNSVIFDNYYIFETILTSPEASISEFDESGMPCYVSETRREEDIKTLQVVQDGISDYFRTYLQLCPPVMYYENKKLDEKFLKMIHKIVILENKFKKMKVEDPFFNRTTNISDLI